MEEKLIKLIESRFSNEGKILQIENTCMFKISKNLGEEIGKQPTVEEISLTSCRLANLKGLGVLEKLETLDISENTLNDEMLKEYLTRAGSSLKRLFVAGNKISKVETFETMKDKKLRQLDLMGCPITKNVENYRSKLFELISSLRVIDGQNKEGKEVSVVDSEEEQEEKDAAEQNPQELKEFIEQDENSEEEKVEEKDAEETPKQGMEKRLDNQEGLTSKDLPEEKALKKIHNI